MAAYQAETPVYNTIHNRVKSDTEKQYVHSHSIFLSLYRC